MKLNNKLSESSKVWLRRKMKDPFIKKAKLEGYRSRAAYKLIEIDEKYNIFSKDSIIIDIGATPGGWSEISINKCKQKKLHSQIIAIDLLQMQPIEGVDFILGNFEDETTKEQILHLLDQKKANIILNDMAPNSTGQQTLDHLRIMNLCEGVFEYTKEILCEDGVFVSKIFKGSDEQAFVLELRKYFKSVKYCKPESSRKESNEIYIVATGFSKKNI